MINSFVVKELVFGLGADLCGIASVNRFGDAPVGFRPTDLYPEASLLLCLRKDCRRVCFIRSQISPTLLWMILLCMKCCGCRWILL